MSLLRYSVVSRCLGLLLVVAAASKLLGGHAIQAANSALSGSTLQVLIEVEIVVGVWLLWGVAPAISWFVSLILFGAFASGALYLGWTGAPSCGCLGRLGEGISPWYTFGMDIAAVILLFLARPRPNQSGQSLCVRLRIVGLRVLPIAAGAGALLAVVVMVSHLVFGSLENALAYVRSERISVLPTIVDVGEGSRGKQLRGGVKLRNRTDHVIRVVGGTSDCSCVVVGDLPLVVRPGDVGTLTFETIVPGTPGPFVRRALLFTDDTHATVVGFRITGSSTGARGAR